MAATGTEQLELAQAVGARQQVLGEHRPPFVLRILGGDVKELLDPMESPSHVTQPKPSLAYRERERLPVLPL